jgi:multisubunit Na+/H+ antiporter MnhB subunit
LNNTAQFDSLKYNIGENIKGNKQAILKSNFNGKINNKNNRESVVLTSLVCLSLLLVSLAFQFEFIAIAGLAFFTIVTGIGYLLSKKDKSKVKNRLPKTLFIVAIFNSLFGALLAAAFKNLD